MQPKLISSSRTKRRRDSGTLQALFGDMSDVMRDIEVNIGCVTEDDWLVKSRDSTYIPFRFQSL